MPVPKVNLGEGPVWDVQEQALYWIDILGKAVYRYDFASGASRNWSVPTIVGSMAVREQGGLIVSLVDGVYTLDTDTGQCAPLATHPNLDETVQLADGKVDRAGRFVVGASDRAMKQALGGMYSLSHGVLTPVDDDIILANGPCWSPDNTTLYHADSRRQCIYAYDYELATGKVSHRRPWMSTEQLGGMPDGMTVDAEGYVWCAICEGGKVVRFDPSGKPERVIDMPVKLPTSVMFGGPDLDLLFVTTLSPAFLGRPVDPQDGCLFVIEGLGVKGLPEPRYHG